MWNVTLPSWFLKIHLKFSMITDHPAKAQDGECYLIVLKKNNKRNYYVIFVRKINLVFLYF